MDTELNISPRARLNWLIRTYAKDANRKYGLVWANLYAAFKYKYMIDLEVRARNAKKTPLAVAEELGLLPQLLALAQQQLKIN